MFHVSATISDNYTLCLNRLAVGMRSLVMFSKTNDLEGWASREGMAGHGDQKNKQGYYAGGEDGRERIRLYQLV